MLLIAGRACEGSAREDEEILMAIPRCLETRCTQARQREKPHLCYARTPGKRVRSLQTGRQGVWNRLIEDDLRPDAKRDGPR